NALADGAYAYAPRSVGDLARPYYPDGIDGQPSGPLSKSHADWSVFSDGLQLDLVNSAILQHVTFVLGGGPDVAPGACTGLPATPAGLSRLADGIQIFAGGAPIYRGSTLVGAIGVSGDGIDQDDMVSFLGLYNAGLALGGAIANAPAAMRADQLVPQGARLRYVQCPQSPFVNSGEQNVCAGK
ncbi:MAG TPA: heme-binding protein, partial [Nevskiaceae bacterium]|nr:heme-binding protein [Nevskiaceae bacterium]